MAERKPLLKFTGPGEPALRRMGRVTGAWHVHSLVDGSRLGYVDWRNGWRRYVFNPAMGTIYDAGCLREIADFCEEKTRDQQEAAARRRAARP